MTSKSFELLSGAMEDACALLCDTQWFQGKLDAEYCTSCGARNDYPENPGSRWHCDDCKSEAFLRKEGWR